MSNRNPGLLYLFLRETGCDADFECRLQFPLLVFAVRAGGYGHALEARDEDAVCECLLMN